MTERTFFTIRVTRTTRYELRLSAPTRDEALYRAGVLLGQRGPNVPTVVDEVIEVEADGDESE